MRVSIYVEGGGDSKDLHVRCREGFKKLIGKAGFRDRMPGIVACGGRQHAFDMFRTAIGKGQASTQYSLLTAKTWLTLQMNFLLVRQAPGIISNCAMAGCVLKGQMTIRHK